MNGPVVNRPAGTELSERAQQLIPKARIVSFSNWSGISAEAIARLQSADDESRYLTDDDLAVIAPSLTAFDSALQAAEVDTTRIVRQLREQATEIVDEARATVLQAFPDILEPGGGLHPPMRAEACWRDFWQFLRCITYGIAGQQTSYTNPDGLAAMEELYKELRVPLPAMLKGLKGIKKASLSRFSNEAQPALVPYFDHLINQLSAFVQT
ncbi:MAG: phycobilisome protein [Phormidesmis sp.]